MSNGTHHATPQELHDRLSTLLESYRGPLRADERRLHEAMLAYERSCWSDVPRRAA